MALNINNTHYHARPDVTDAELRLGLDKLQDMLADKIEEKGRKAFVSTHEIFGAIDEEHDELRDAVRNCHKTIDGRQIVSEELLDIAIAALFGMICVDNNKVDW
jgi:uncharacterized membrane protein YcjF (UPF0283 family)